jgi:hypothetical protein
VTILKEGQLVSGEWRMGTFDLVLEGFPEEAKTKLGTEKVSVSLVWK